MSKEIIMKKIKKLVIILIIINLILLFLLSCSTKNPTIRDDIKKKIDYSINEGLSYFQKNQIEKAINSFTQAYELATTIDDVDRIIRASLKLIEVYIFINQPDKAFPFLISAKKLAEKEEIEKYFSPIFYFLARFYELKQDLDNAIAIYKEAINSAKNDLDKSIALNGLGLLFLKQKKFDDALLYLEKAYKINKKLKNYDQLSNNSFNMAICYFNKKDYDKSLQYALEALKYDKLSENSLNILEDCKLLAKIYEYLNNIETALYYITKALNIAQIIAKDQVQFLEEEQKRLESLLKN